MSARTRVLVSGAGGLLAGRLAALLASRFDVVAGVRTTPAPSGLTTMRLDLLDEAALARALDEAALQAVVHAAAIGEPDRCERDPELAMRVNAEASGVLGRLCRERGLRLIALSTDMVFDGRRGWRREDDEPAPVQVYGRSKLAGERALLDAHPDAAVVRVCLVGGRGHGRRGSATESIAWTLSRGERARLFTDQRRTPVDPETVAELVSCLLRRRETGIFHCAGAEPVTRHELGLRVAERLGLDPGRIDAVRSTELPQAASRPPDVTLTCDRARGLGWTPRPLDDAVREGRAAPDAW